MKRNVIQSLKNHATLLVLLTILSCDSFKEDFIEAEKKVVFSKTEYYVLPGSSVVIDLESVVTKSFANASLSISSNPIRGTLFQLGPLMLKYDADRDLLNGDTDQFVFSVLSEGQVIATETMTIFVKKDLAELPCALYAAEDKAYVKSGSTVSVSFLKNDRICGVADSPQISIHLNPRFGESKLVGDSIIVYTPGPGYSGRDELVYKVADSSGENFSFGIVSISEWEVQFFPTPITPMRSRIDASVPDINDMFFVNDKTGFLGGYGVYKTTDGGITWRVSYPVTNDNLFSIRDIYFLDADHGYATYSGVEKGPCGCLDGQGGWLLTTVDGGETWKHLNVLNLPVHSVFFTSSTTGFVGTYFNDNETHVSQSILKTDDGGASWKLVFTYSAEFSLLKIWFTDSKTGYAYDKFTLFRTIDGGESWISAVENEYIMSAAVLPENIINANFTSGSSLETSPSTMYRSLDGDSWIPTTNFPYTILSQAFSPSGNVGFAIGIGGTDPSVLNPRPQTLSINKSVDKGAAWTEVGISEPLYGYPYAIAFPSDTIAYVLGYREVMKFTKQ